MPRVSLLLPSLFVLNLLACGEVSPRIASVSFADGNGAVQATLEFEYADDILSRLLLVDAGVVDSQFVFSNDGDRITALSYLDSAGQVLASGGFDYDSDDRPATLHFTETGRRDPTIVSIDYDSDDNVTAMNQVSGAWFKNLAFSYDGDGVPNRITSSGVSGSSSMALVDSNADGQITSITGGGSTTSFSYVDDRLSRVDRSTWSSYYEVRYNSDDYVSEIRSYWDGQLDEIATIAYVDGESMAPMATPWLSNGEFFDMEGHVRSPMSLSLWWHLPEL